MPLFGRHRARDDANVTARRRGWALFNNPYPRRKNRSTNPITTTTRRSHDAKKPRRIGRAGEARVPLMTKVKRTLGIQSPSTPRRRKRATCSRRADAATGRRRRGWFSSTSTSPSRTRGRFF